MRPVFGPVRSGDRAVDGTPGAAVWPRRERSAPCGAALPAIRYHSACRLQPRLAGASDPKWTDRTGGCRMRIEKICLALIMLFVSSIGSVAHAAIGISVQWIDVYHELSPIPRTYTKSGGLSFTLQNGKVYSGDHNLRATTAFGQKALFTNSSGVAYATTYKIVGGKIVCTSLSSGQVLKIFVSTDNTSSCVASIQRIKRGSPYLFLDNTDGRHFFSDVETQNLTCRISSR